MYRREKRARNMLGLSENVFEDKIIAEEGILVYGQNGNIIFDASGDQITSIETQSGPVYTNEIDTTIAGQGGLTTLWNKAGTINIGTATTGPATINLGNFNTTVNIAGITNNVQTTDLAISDKNIQLNKDASGSGTARGAGINIRDSNTNNQGYIQTDLSTGQKFEFKAPENSGIVSLIPVSGQTVSAITTKPSANKEQSIQDSINPDILRLSSLTTEPTDPAFTVNGAHYYNSITDTAYVRLNGAWRPYGVRSNQITITGANTISASNVNSTDIIRIQFDNTATAQWYAELSGYGFSANSTSFTKVTIMKTNTSQKGYIHINESNSANQTYLGLSYITFDLTTGICSLNAYASSSNDGAVSYILNVSMSTILGTPTIPFII